MVYYIHYTVYGGGICTNASFWPMDVSLFALGSKKEK